VAAIQVGVGIGREGVMIPHGQGAACSLQPQALAGSALLQAKQGAVGLNGTVQLYVLLLETQLL